MISGLILGMLLNSASAQCRFDPGPTTGRPQVVAAARGTVVFEIRLAGQAPPPTALLKVLSEREVPATVLASTTWAQRNGDSLKGIAKDGHEVGYWMNLREDLGLAGDIAVAPDLSHWVRSLRTARDKVQAATRAQVTTIGVARLPEVGEKAMEGIGFRAILPSERTVNDSPRRVASLHSAAGRARILGEGPYDDGCGAALPAWTPASLDRATRVAARGQWVRIALPPDPDAAPMLARWLDEVVVSQKWRVLTASKAARSADPGLGAPTATADTGPTQAARHVQIEHIDQAAGRLSTASRIPRQLPGRLNPTEAFLGLTQILVSAEKPSTVALGPLRPPAEVARSSLPPDPLPLESAQIRAAARDILPGLSGQVPGFVSVGSHTLTAAEFLRVMAMVHTGVPPVAHKVTDPDPYAPGGGWGESSGL